jgi:NlpC/P60 family putative phage cell wall peptidase
MIARQTIIAAARTWIGTPFKHQGRTKGPRGGIDCIGLVWGVGKEIGIDTVIPRNYSPQPNGAHLIEGCDRLLVKVPIEKMAPGVVLIMWGVSPAEPQHFGIVGERHGIPSLIHAFSKRGCVLEQPVDRFWLKHIAAVYEYPGTEPHSSHVSGSPTP